MATVLTEQQEEALRAKLLEALGIQESPENSLAVYYALEPFKKLCDANFVVKFAAAIAYGYGLMIQPNAIEQDEIFTIMNLRYFNSKTHEFCTTTSDRIAMQNGETFTIR